MRIASVGYDGVRVWDASTRLQVYENHDGKMLKRGGAWSPDSIHFAWGSVPNDTAIRIWDSISFQIHVKGTG